MKIVFIIFLSLISLSSLAQDNKKKEEYKLSATIKTVRGFLKESKNSNANDEVNKAVKEHPEARSSAQLYALQAQALQNLVLDENKKMYLNQKPDTSKYFSLIYSLYNSAFICDSLDQIPDSKGRVALKYRDSNQQRLLQFRKNLATAGRYFYQKKDFKNAYQFTDLYLSSKSYPIFNTQKGRAVIDSEKDSLSHSSLAVFLAYAYNNYKGVAKYLQVALNDTARLPQLLEVGAKSYYELGDTLSAHILLFRGVGKYPTNEFFYMTLVKYYNLHSDYESALKLIDSILVHMPDNRNCWFLKAKEHEYLGQLDKAVDAMNHVVTKYDEDYEAYAAIGDMNLRRAHHAYDNFNLKVTDSNYVKGRQLINEYYVKAKEAYEKCRKLAESNTALWMSGLRECYYKLNLGKELKMLEKMK